MADKFERLEATISGMGSMAVAFSGGADSTFLLGVAHDVLGDRVLAVTGHSQLYPDHQLQESARLAKHLGARQVVIRTDELNTPAFKSNPPDRCYYCKKALFAEIRRIADQHGLRHVADGTNADDLSDHRPGTRAAAELGIRSPLQETGFTKADVRRHSRLLGLPTWDKPSFACLASRFPYGTAITGESLARVAGAEEFLRTEGFRQYRVRHHGATARIEVPSHEIAKAVDEDFRRRLVARFKELGYAYVALDLEGFRSGSMNETLKPG